MNTIRELFVNYTRADDATTIMRLVSDRETLDTIKDGAPLFKRVGSIINVDSFDEADPILTIVCLTAQPLASDELQPITNEVIAWLQYIGEWWT